MFVIVLIFFFKGMSKKLIFFTFLKGVEGLNIPGYIFNIRFNGNLYPGSLTLKAPTNAVAGP